jgi:hypothetical protein
MRRSRLLLLVAAAAGLGGALAAAWPGTADAPGGPDAVPVKQLASTDVGSTELPPAPEPIAVAGAVTDLSLDSSGVLTISGVTESEGVPADVPIAVWIDREPARTSQPVAHPVTTTATSAPAESDTTPLPGVAAEGTPQTVEPKLPGRFTRTVQLREGPQDVCTIALNQTGPDEVLACDRVMYRAELLDVKMIVADYGNGATPRLGIAGEGTPTEAAARVAARAEEWEEATGIPTIPAFDYIQTVAQASSGSDGDYSAHTSREDLDTYLAAIREVGGMLILDFQPGGGRFLDQVVQYEDYLIQPDVGLALDTEWRMPWGVPPATIIGYADASEINEVGEYLAGLVTDNDLPQKPFVVHQFTRRMIRNRDQIVNRPELATIFHIDGHGTRQLKKGVYKSLLPSEDFHTGFKLFFDEDTGLMTPLEVRDDLARTPAMVSYQ